MYSIELHALREQYSIGEIDYKRAIRKTKRNQEGRAAKKIKGRWYIKEDYVDTFLILAGVKDEKRVVYQEAPTPHQRECTSRQVGKTFRKSEHVCIYQGKEYYDIVEIIRKLGYTPQHRRSLVAELEEGFARRFTYHELKELGHSDPGQRGRKMVTITGLLKVAGRLGLTDVQREWIYNLTGTTGLTRELLGTIKHTRPEIEFLSALLEVLEPFGYKCIRQYPVLSYRIDCYIEDLNVAIEYDEKDHRSYSHEQHEGRQECIEKELGCRFIRVSDRESHLYNIGLIMKELLTPPPLNHRD